MYKLIEWDESLDLSSFYKEAEKRGFYNNLSQRVMVDCFKNEKHYNVWILYYNTVPIGSVAAHSFDDVMGVNSYRIAARTCVFTDKIPGVYGTSLRTKSVITEFQNPTSQFLIPQCIDWAPNNAALYITSNNSNVGTQRGVHNVFGPLMQKIGVMERIKDVEYRGLLQTVWQLYPDKFLENLNKYPRW